jgi:hypothetical protein
MDLILNSHESHRRYPRVHGTTGLRRTETICNDPALSITNCQLANKTNITARTNETVISTYI